MGTSQDENGGGTTGYQLPTVAWGMEEEAPEELSGSAVPAEGVAEAAEPVAASVEAATSAVEPEPEARPAPARLGALKRALTQVPSRAARHLASVAPSAAGPAATGSGTSGTDEAGAPHPAEERSGRRRVPRPAVAAAAVGVVLMGLPLVMGHGEVGTDAVEPLGGTGTSRPDTPVPQPAGPGTPSGTPAAATTGPATPSGTPTDPAATAPPGTPAPGTPEQQPAPGAVVAAGAPLDRAADPAPAARSGTGSGTGTGTANRPAAGPQPGTGPAPQGPAGQPPAQPAAPQPVPQQPQQPPQQPAAPSYSALAGPGCSGSGTGYRENGHSGGSRDWVTNHDGGTGCGGDYTSVPMSGDRNKDDENSVSWTFSTGPVSSGSCRISVYVPNSGDLKAVGGAPAYYTVQNSGGGTAGSFTVNQPQHRGQWVDVGTFQLGGGRIGVQLHTRGIDWGGTAGAHLAASTVKADCTG
ncbi:hypothetical protein [Kitasatospora sp. NPDC059827]|uniref:golvesin C-terminal-like domain-containing protein n=1 Tax=Kitasatospora sp. NPDC059827 TaxID=3346964 RepID=UPI00365ACB05